MRSGWCSRKGALHAEPNRSGAERAYRAAPARDAHAPMAKTAGATRRPAPTWARDFAAAAHLTPPETKHKYRGRCSSEVHDTVFSAVIALLEPVVKRELAYYADETTWDEYPESDAPLRLLGDEVLMEATWAVVGDDSLASVLALVERCLDTAFDTPGRPASLTGRAAAEALIGAFPDHFECQAPGDEACLERLRATEPTSSNPLCDLVRDKVMAPEDALPAGLTILAALADLARTSAFSVLDASA